MHDGDKTQLAFLDFVADKFAKAKTEERMYLDFQLKNGLLGEWNNIEGKYENFTGKILSNGDTLELNGLSRQQALNLIQENLGLSEEQLNMRTRTYNTYLHAVGMRAQKELKKHYNEIYEMMGSIQKFSTESKIISNDDVDRIKGVMNLYQKEVNSRISHKNIKRTLEFLDSLKNSGRTDYRVEVNDLNLVGATALYKIINGNTDSQADLYKAVKKDIDKFISRGNFDEFYKTKNSKAIFDELSGVRNTGLTHSYATQIRMASIELKELDPSKILDQIGEFASPELNVDQLTEMVRRQEYYYGSTDLLVDNMIESAISAKHGLTLGGLEGSKIFINTLLSETSRSMNNNIIGMYDDIFIENKLDKKVNMLENLAKFKKLFDDRENVLEDITTRLTDEGLESSLLYKLFDLGESGFDYVAKKHLGEKVVNRYKEYGKEYSAKVKEIEIGMMKNMLNNDVLDTDEFEIYKGLNLFGELLIQNDPGLEYDAQEALDAIKKYREGEISAKQLFAHKEVVNLEHQAYTSLGSAASISNIGNLRDYLSDFVAKKNYDDLKIEFQNEVSQLSDVVQLIDEHGFERVFDTNFSIKDKYKKSVKNTESLDKLTERYGKRYMGVLNKFSNEVLSSTNPMQVFSETLNPNNTLFSEVGKEGNKSIEMIKQLKDRGVRGVNESSLSKSLERVDQVQNKFLSDFINQYRQYDPDFDTFSVNEVLDDLRDNYYYDDFSDSIISRLDKSINEAVFNKFKKQLTPQLRIGKNSMTKLRISPFLTREERYLQHKGKLFHVDSSKGFDFKKIRDVLVTQKNSEYIIDDVSFLYDKKTNKFDSKAYKQLIKDTEGTNIYFSERLAKKRFFNESKLRNQLLSVDQRKQLGRDLLLAKKHLGEDFTPKNIEKRLNFKFDSKLAAIASTEEYFIHNKINRPLEYREKVAGVLSKILQDFRTSDYDISTQYVSDKYIRYAMRYVDKGRTYTKLDLSTTKKDLAKVGRTRDIIQKFLKDDKEFIDNQNIVDKDMFLLDLHSNLLHTEVNSIEQIKSLIETSITDIKEEMKINGTMKTKFDKEMLDNFKPRKYINKKTGALAIAGTIAAAAYQLVTPYFSKGNGVYTINQNPTHMSEMQIAERLGIDDFKDDMYMKSLKKSVKKANFKSVNKKGYF